MAQLILKHDDGSEEIIRDNVNNYLNKTDIIITDETVAIKTWTRENIRQSLKSEGYKGTDEQVDEIIQNGDLTGLDEESDGEWQILHDAIYSLRPQLMKLNQ